MTLLTKKLVGLALLLMGGLTAAHGAASDMRWETILGLLGLALGVVLLLAKISRRNASR